MIGIQKQKELFFCAVGTEFLYVLNLDEFQSSNRRRFFRRPGIQCRSVHLVLIMSLGQIFFLPPPRYFGFLRSLPIHQCVIFIFIFFQKKTTEKSSDLSTDIMFFAVLGEQQEGKVHTIFFSFFFSIFKGFCEYFFFSLS